MPDFIETVLRFIRGRWLSHSLITADFTRTSLSFYLHVPAAFQPLLAAVLKNVSAGVFQSIFEMADFMPHSGCAYQ